MLYEYLMSPQNFTHVLMLDADAALVKHSMDILGVLAQTCQMFTGDRHVKPF